MEMEAQQVESAGGGDAAPSLLQRVIMVFVSPGKLGEALRTNSPWFWTLAIVAVISFVALLLIPGDIWLEMVEDQVTEGGPSAETMASITRFAGSGFAIVMTFLGAAVTAGVLYLVFNVVFGQDLTYKQHLSAMSHVYWIAALGMLLTVPVWISQANMQAQLGLGLLLSDEPTSFVEKFINGFTIFGLWGTIAIATVESGLSRGRVSTGKAVGTLLVVYVIWAAVKTVFPTG